MSACTCARKRLPEVPIDFMDRDAACPRHGDGTPWWARIQKRGQELADELGLTKDPQ